MSKKTQHSIGKRILEILHIFDVDELMVGIAGSTAEAASDLGHILEVLATCVTSIVGGVLHVFTFKESIQEAMLAWNERNDPKAENVPLRLAKGIWHAILATAGISFSCILALNLLITLPSILLIMSPLMITGILAVVSISKCQDHGIAWAEAREKAGQPNARKKDKEKAIAREREFAFSLTTTLGSMVTLFGSFVGAGLCAVAFAGASVATGGMLPLIIIGVGALICIGIKIFEYIDQKLDHRPTRAIRNFFTGEKTAPMSARQKTALEQKKARMNYNKQMALLEKNFPKKLGDTNSRESIKSVQLAQAPNDIIIPSPTVETFLSQSTIAPM